MNSTAPIIACVCLAGACALLSIVVVLRRWAFVGEGIGHSAFGGAGTAWLLALFVPALDRPWMPYVAVVIFCVLTAILIGRLSRARPIGIDATVGVFLVASMAWGFLAQQVYSLRRHAMPPAFETLLFGRMGEISPQFALAAAAISAAVILILLLLGKEIAAYCFDPLTAQTSGVRTGFIHDLLMILIALVVVIGSRIVGSVLVVALLVLPGATAILISRKLHQVIIAALVSSFIGSIVGVSASMRWRSIPTGPAIVLTLLVLFVAALIIGRVRRSAP